MQEPEAVVSGHPMLIAGELVESSSGLSDPVVNPATGENFDYVPHGSREDLDRAVDAAAEAFKTWSVTPFEERAKCLLKFAEEVEKIADELAKAQTMEQGKPLANSMGEVRGLIGSCKRYAETGEITDDIVSEDDDAQYKIVYAPRGVVGGIAPWNFPIGTVSGKILPSTITGNTCVIKPSPYTPLATAMLSEAASKAFPPGVVNSERRSSASGFFRRLSEMPLRSSDRRRRAGTNDR